MIKIINHILIGLTIVFISIDLFVIIRSVLAEESIPTFFVRSTSWLAIIWFIFEVLKKFFEKKKDKIS